MTGAGSRACFGTARCLASAPGRAGAACVAAQAAPEKATTATTAAARSAIDALRAGWQKPGIDRSAGMGGSRPRRRSAARHAAQPACELQPPGRRRQPLPAGAIALAIERVERRRRGLARLAVLRAQMANLYLSG